MKLSQHQRYAIASALATMSEAAVYRKLANDEQALHFARRIAVHYRRADGYVPRVVIKLVNEH